MRKASELLQLALIHPWYLNGDKDTELLHLCYTRDIMLENETITRDEEALLADTIYDAMDAMGDGEPVVFLIDIYPVYRLNTTDKSRRELLRSPEYKVWAFKFWELAICNLQAKGL